MKIYNLFQLVFSSAEDGIWADSDRDHARSKPVSWGFVFKLRAGWIYRPVDLRPSTLFGKRDEESSVWINGKHQFVLKLWFPLLPFLSFSLGGRGFYLGFKEYGVDWETYKVWADTTEIYDGSQALALSASLRRTRL